MRMVKTVTSTIMHFSQRLLMVAMMVMLLEIVQKFSTLSELLEFQDRTMETHALHAWSPLDRNEATKQNATQLHDNSNNDACRIPPSLGPEGKMGFQALTKIQIARSSADKNQDASKRRMVRLLCVVMTDETQHETSLKAILETYAPYCDGFLAASNVTDASVQAVDLRSAHPHNEWQQVQAVWKYIYEEYMYPHKFQFDAFHFGGDDMYVIPENLRQLVSSFDAFFEKDTPKYLGGAVVVSRKMPELRYCGGGAGYTLNRAAVELVANNMECKAQTNPKNAAALPADQQMAVCLREHSTTEDRLQCTKTTDSQMRLRYIEFGLEYQSTWNKKIPNPPIKVKPLAEHHGIFMRQGMGSIAPDVVSIHLENYATKKSAKPIQPELYSKAETMRRVHAILRGDCKSQWEPPVDALDAQGNAGYIHDPTLLKHNPLALTWHPEGDDYGVCQAPMGQGVEGPSGYQGLQKILQKKNVPNNMKKKVLCMIYTHSGRHDRVRAIAETYGPQCDGFIAASNRTDPSIGAVNLLHEGPESYNNMWLKVRAMWQYAHKHYLDDYDFFHIGGDDHYVLPENLRYMASTGSWKGPWDQTQPLFLGGNMIDFPMTNLRYCGGGSGYTLNTVALKLLVEELFDTYPCKPHHHASDEDRIISSCFRTVDIKCMDTNDEKNETRYHQANVEFHASWTKDKPSVWNAKNLEQMHGIASKERMSQISETTVSFHLKGQDKGVQDRGMRRYHAILNGLCAAKAK